MLQNIDAYLERNSKTVQNILLLVMLYLLLDDTDKFGRKPAIKIVM